MVTPLTQAELAQVTKLAQEQAVAQGTTPEKALWSYATSQGISPGKSQRLSAPRRPVT